MNQKEMDTINKKQPLKKMIIPQLLISVSLFSFFVSYSSLYSSSLSLVYPKFHHFFSFQLNKNCLFLICNGLLVFLAKTSGLIQPPTANDVLFAGDTFQPPSSLHKYVLLEEPEETTRTAAHDPDGGKTAAAAAADGTIEEVSIFIAESEEEQGDHETGAAADYEDDAEKDGNEQLCKSCWLFDEDGEQLYGQEDDNNDDDEDEDEEEEEEMSTEELNQKFEDFIRKMKEEIIINEARQKTLMLN